jgi:hypothetical protein
MSQTRQTVHCIHTAGLQAINRIFIAFNSENVESYNFRHTVKDMKSDIKQKKRADYKILHSTASHDLSVKVCILNLPTQVDEVNKNAFISQRI